VHRDAVINIRLPKEIKEAVRHAADDDHGRSLSGMVVRILGEWCKANGYLKHDPTRARASREK
jgi:hypothetical protein